VRQQAFVNECFHGRVFVFAPNAPAHFEVARPKRFDVCGLPAQMAIYLPRLACALWHGPPLALLS